MVDPAARASVVVPTYNRSGLLRQTLESLTEQDFSVTDFEVVVSDDGSDDDTAEVARSFAGRLRVLYHRQEDLGFRAAAARNSGARIATAPILVFLDCGMLAGPDFVREHLAAQRRPHVVVGYEYDFAQVFPEVRLDDPLLRMPPPAIRDRMRRDRRFRDSRHHTLSMADFDLSRLVVPWWICWSSNVSLPTDDFWAVGGFDEDFRSWGAEDVELAYRLHRAGLPFVLSRRAWAIEQPHPRTAQANHDTSMINNQMMHDKHPDPLMEICVHVTLHAHWLDVEPLCQALCDWRSRARPLEVTAELAAEAGSATGRVAVFGSGGQPPSSWAGSGTSYTLLDFDSELLAEAARSGPYATRHAIGLRTGLPDDSFDLVVISSRLAGLWPQWSEALLAEAGRIGREVRVAAGVGTVTGQHA